MSTFRQWKLEAEAAMIVSKKALSDPPGYRSSAKELEPRKVSTVTKADQVKRKQSALMARAMEPAKQAGFMCFMLYMSGNGLQIFSIMMLVSCIYSPVAAIFNAHKAIPQDEAGELSVFLPRICFMLIQGGQFLFAMYKLHNMGLLPTYASDWVSQLDAPLRSELSYGSIL